MPQSSKKQLGDSGEALVVNWLQQKGWKIIAQQWHCRWGELDIVAHHGPPQSCLAFVEVKTRRRGSLDHDGRLAITPQKQRKLWRSAERFLSQHPQYRELPCRFDVALVAHSVSRDQPVLSIEANSDTSPSLALIDYIANAFQLS
ncbi:MAG: YraN family protein [Leptolyngbya sp. SIO1E4]|nr:YraN family protein [Leptolyngbya sp. SIO1E4]